MTVTVPNQPTAAPEQEDRLTHEIAELFPRQGAWSEHDYWALPDCNRIIELSNGRLIIPPIPTTEHQDIVGNIYTALRMHVRTHNLGKVGLAPLPVRLWPGKIREPDVMVMLEAHRERVQSQAWGAPDLVVEVLSPGTKQEDRVEKLRDYAAAGVAEYWIVVPETRTVEVYRLDGESYLLHATYSGEMPVESIIVSGLKMPVVDVFSE